MVFVDKQERCRRLYQSSDCADEGQRRAKRQKSRFNNYPPHVWDKLSVIKLTYYAVREFDRRTATDASASTTEVLGTGRRLLRPNTHRLKQYAREGGPDLGRLRGYADRLDMSDAMGRQQPSHSERSNGCGLPESSPAGMAKPTRPYDADFEQILIDSGVYPDEHPQEDGSRPPEPQNLEDLQRRLAQRRPSLATSVFTEDDFRNFRYDNRNAATELDITTNVIPAILGTHDRRHYSTMNRSFTGMDELDLAITKPKPDKFYGAVPRHIDPRVRNDLSRYITPGANMPVVPNNFFEFKGPSGSGVVLRRQAMYDAAIGARAMWHLQNYGQAAPSYDGNAYSTVSTYDACSGTLQIYAMHPVESATGEPEYHMTQLCSFAMTASSDAFRQGAAAFRNARDMSMQQRNEFIANANAIARNPPPESVICSGQESIEKSKSVDPQGSNGGSGRPGQ